MLRQVAKRGADFQPVTRLALARGGRAQRVWYITV